MKNLAQKYNLNDWDNETSQSKIPMIESKSRIKYNSFRRNSDISINGAVDTSHDTSHSDTLDMRAKLSWQYKDEYKTNRNFKLIGELSYACCLLFILIIFILSITGIWYGSQMMMNAIDHNIEDTEYDCYLIGYNQSVCNYNNEYLFYEYIAYIPSLCGNETMLLSEYECPSKKLPGDINFNGSTTCYIHNCESTFSFNRESRDRLLAPIVIICVSLGFILITCFAWYKSCKSCSI